MCNEQYNKKIKILKWNSTEWIKFRGLRMNRQEVKDEKLRCFSCGKLATNVHLCKTTGISQIICDNCCKKLLKGKRCQHRECGHYRPL